MNRLSNDQVEVQRISGVYQARWRAEVDLLATLAESPRRSRAILTRLGIGESHFAHEDTAAIFRTLDAAGAPTGPPWSTERMFATARAALRDAHEWREADPRAYISGTWSDGSLAALLGRVAFDEAEIVNAIANLIEATEAQTAMEVAR